MKTKALFLLLIAVAGCVSTLQANPAVVIRVGGNNNGCNARVVRPAPVFYQPNVMCRPAPVFYQPCYPVTGFSPTYYSIGPTTVTFNSGPVTVSSAAPIVVPPPVILNQPVVVQPGTPFTWRR